MEETIWEVFRRHFFSVIIGGAIASLIFLWERTPPGECGVYVKNLRLERQEILRLQTDVRQAKTEAVEAAAARMRIIQERDVFAFENEELHQKIAALNSIAEKLKGERDVAHNTIATQKRELENLRVRLRQAAGKPDAEDSCPGIRYQLLKCERMLERWPYRIDKFRTDK